MPWVSIIRERKWLEVLPCIVFVDSRLRLAEDCCKCLLTTCDVEMNIDTVRIIVSTHFLQWY